MDPRKVQSIVEWATPTSCSEVRRFTGLPNYYRRFVEGYPELATPLTALPSRRGEMIRVDRIAGLPTTAAGFETIQNHVDLLSGKVHAVPTRTTATAADAAAIIRGKCLRSGDGFPDVLVVDHDSKFTGGVFSAFVKGWGSTLIVGSAYHKDTIGIIIPTPRWSGPTAS